MVNPDGRHARNAGPIHVSHNVKRDDIFFVVEVTLTAYAVTVDVMMYLLINNRFCLMYRLAADSVCFACRNKRSSAASST